MSEKILLPVLGVVMTGYALYALFNLKLPRLEHSAWAYLIGFLSGLLSGAYSVGGPPVIIYGDCRGWEPDEFKSNMQGFFVLNDAAGDYLPWHRRQPDPYGLDRLSVGAAGDCCRAS